MVITAKPEMIPQLKELWRMGFGDSYDYIDFVFENLLTPEKILAYVNERGEPLGMLCMEPLDLVSGDYVGKGIYMYAFNIHPRFRSRGVGGRLLQGFNSYLKAKGYVASVLTPADKDLFQYYGSRGYETQFAVQQMKIDPDYLTPTGRPCILVPRDLDSLYKMRSRFFGNSGLFARWEHSYLKFVGDEARLRKGGVLLSNCKGEEGYLVYRVEDDEVVITEFAVSPSTMDDVLHTLHKRLGARLYKIRLTADYDGKIKPRVLPFAMIQWYDRQNISSQLTQAPYISHVMD